MNIKLLCASLIGVGSIGGAVAGGIYLSKSKKTNTQDSSKTKAVESNSNPKQPDTTPKTTLEVAPPAAVPEVTQSPQGPSSVEDAGPKGP